MTREQFIQDMIDMKGWSREKATEMSEIFKWSAQGNFVVSPLTVKENMLSNENYMRILRREKKTQTITEEVYTRYITHRDAMVESFAGLSMQEQLQAFQELSVLLSAKMSGF